MNECSGNTLEGIIIPGARHLERYYGKLLVEWNKPLMIKISLDWIVGENVGRRNALCKS